MSDKDEKELDLILEEAAQWYMEYTALAAFKAQNDYLIKNATPSFIFPPLVTLFLSSPDHYS